jgi:hypothetical protein
VDSPVGREVAMAYSQGGVMIEVHIEDTDGAIEFGRAEHDDIIGDARRREFEEWKKNTRFVKEFYPGVGQGFIDETNVKQYLKDKGYTFMHSDRTLEESK